MPAAPSPIARGPHWQLDDVVITRLAQELAREVYTIPEVLARFGLDTETFKERVRYLPAFERAYSEAKRLWDGSPTERVKYKAGMLFEDWLTEADRMFHDTTQPMTAKVEMLKHLSKVAGFDSGDKQSAIAPGDRVLVQINLGAGGQPNTPPIVIDQVAPVVDLSIAPQPLPEWNVPREGPVPPPQMPPGMEFTPARHEQPNATTLVPITEPQIVNSRVVMPPPPPPPRPPEPVLPRKVKEKVRLVPFKAS